MSAVEFLPASYNDRPASAVGLMPFDKRAMVVHALDRVESTVESERDPIAERELWWELGALSIVRAPVGTTHFRGGSYDDFALFYHLSAATIPYLAARASVTPDPVLRIYYLEFLIAQGPQRGRQWIEKLRAVLSAYRAYAELNRANAPLDPKEFPGLNIDRALERIEDLIRTPGVVPDSAHPEIAEWIIGLTVAAQTFPTDDERDAALMRHRYTAPYLSHLPLLRPDAVAAHQRDQVLALLDEVLVYCEANPLTDNLANRAAEVDAALRKHWGETDTNRVMVRRKFDACMRRVELHRSGSNILAAHFLREARRLVSKYRSYFTQDEVARLEIDEHNTLESAVQNNEFVRIGVPMFIDPDVLDQTRESPEATVGALLALARHGIPNRDELFRQSGELSAIDPLASMIGRTVIGKGKVVGEAPTVEQIRDLDVERHAILLALLNGAAALETARRGAKSQSLTGAALATPIAALGIDAGTMELLRHGLERFLGGDYVSAAHILVPRVEDVVRQHLSSIGVDTTQFIKEADGTSRTDDISFGSLLRTKLPDGRTVLDYFGSDLVRQMESIMLSQTGLNLRNNFAHGLARPSHCSGEIVGAVLQLLYALATVPLSSSEDADPPA